MKTRLLSLALVFLAFSCVNTYAAAYYTLTVNANGGTNGGPDKYEDLKQNTGYTIYLPTKQGYTLTSLAGQAAITASNQTVGAAYLSNYQGFTGSSPEILTFDGVDDYYDLGTTYCYTDVITVNIWAYMDDWKEFKGLTESHSDFTVFRSFISCSQNGGWNIRASSTSIDDGFAFAVYDNVLENDGRTYVECTVHTTAEKHKLKNFKPGWHMFTLVVRSKKLYGYIDGDPINKTGVALTGGKIHYNINSSQTSHILLGAEASRVRSDRDDSYVESRPIKELDGEEIKMCFKGKTSNLAIMHAGLSDTNVKTLYNNPGCILYKTPDVSSGGDRTIKAVWKQNADLSKTTLTIQTNGGENTMTSSSFSQKEGTSVTVTKPLHTLPLEAWDGNTEGRKYISNFQGFPGSSPEILEFDGNTYYDLGRDYMFKDKLTVNLWAYMDDWSQLGTKKLISCTASGGWNIEGTGNSNFIRFQVYNEGDRYRGAVRACDVPAAGWHMFTLVFDGKCVRSYIDSKPIATGMNFVEGAVTTSPLSDEQYGDTLYIATGTNFIGGKIGYHDKNHIILGAEASGSAGGVEAGYNFKGKMRNVCIMNTAISATDVATLYKNPGIAQYYFQGADKTLKATWKTASTTTLTVNADNGTANKNTSNTEGNVQRITTPYKEASTFVSWGGNAEGKKYISNYQGYTSSTPTGKTFNGTSDYDILGKEYMYEDKITVNIWAYMDNWANFAGKRMISCTHGGGWNIEPYATHKSFAFLLHHHNPWINLKDNYMRAHSNHLARHEKVDTLEKTISTGARVYYDTPPDTEGFVEGTDIVLANNTWHMFTFTFDGQTLLGYIDGILVAKQVAPSFGKINYYNYGGNDYKNADGSLNVTNAIFIGAEAGSENDKPDTDGCYFPGKMRNVAVMNTAISADEVTALYKSPGIVRYYFPDANKTLKALWNEKPEPPSADLTVNPNGGTNTMEQDSYNQPSGSALSVKQPTKLDNIFSYWGEPTAQNGLIYHSLNNYNGIQGEKVTIDQSTSSIFVSRSGTKTVIFNGIEELLFDGKTCYDLGTAYKYTDLITINVWARMDDWDKFSIHNATTGKVKQQMRLFSCTHAGGLNIEDNDYGYIRFSGYDSQRVNLETNQLGDYSTAIADMLWSDLNTLHPENNKWHMFTYVFDGEYLRGYIDGDLVATSDQYVGTLQYNDNSLFLGAEAGAGNTSEAQSKTAHMPFEGKMKNFAIMHAALTPTQVKELYDNPTTTRHYFHEKQPEIKAVWKELPKLAAKKNNNEIVNNNVITLHTLLGKSVSTGDIAITSNSIGNTTLSSSDAAFKLGNTTVGKGGGNVQVTYTPTKAGEDETTTLKLTADGSTPKEYTIKGRAYLFDIAYWNGLGFGVQLDKNDVLKDCRVTINGNPVNLTEHASEGEGMYFVDLTGKQDLSNTYSGHEVDITFNHTNGPNFTSKIKLPIFPEAGTNKIETVDDDVIITKGRSITQTTSEAVTIGDLYIQPTATLQLAEGATINANSIVFYSDGDAVPQMVLPEGSTFNLSEDDPTIYFVKRVPIGRYYDFSLPYDCNVNEICFVDGSGKDKRNIDWEIVYYDGEKRLENNGYSTGWRVFQGDILEAGVGYSIGIAPTLTTKDVVFPMKLTDNKRLTPDYTGVYHQVTTLDNNDKHIPIIAHGAGKEYNHITPNNKGWNFVGNPYLTKYAYQLDQNNEIKEVLKAGKLIVNNIENNGYMYLTIPRVSGTYQYYEQKIYTETTIPPFSAFFIQAGQTGHLKFIPSSRTLQSLAARKVADAQVTQPVYVGVALSSETYKDETSLVIDNQFTQDYEIGSDLEKMLATGNRPQVYVQDAAYKYAFKSLPQADAAGVNPLGVYLPAKGTYTFAIKESYDMTRVQTVYLTDKEKNVTVNLLQTPYEFTVDGAKHTAERFYLSVVLAADVTTDMTQTGATTWAVWQDAPLQIRVQGLHIGETLRIFSSTGQMVYEDIMTDTEGIFTLPTAGTYCVQTIGGNATQMKKIMVSL